MKKILIAGMGQVGKALFNIVKKSGKYEVKGFDIDGKPKKCDYLHITYPMKDKDEFIDTTVKYIKIAKPKLTIIHSTVLPRTAEKIVKELDKDSIAYSPIRGQHSDLEGDMLRYTKFAAAFGEEVLEEACQHLDEIGFEVGLLGEEPKDLELAKLLDTTQYGVLIGWAQEAEMMCRMVGVKHDIVREFGKQTHEFYGVRPDIFSGVIGGKCVMPNIELLRQMFYSDILDVVVKSNDRKKEEVEDDRSNNSS